MGNVSELNDTIVEAELRTLRIPPHLPLETAVGRFQASKNRLLILVCLNFFTRICHGLLIVITVIPNMERAL